MDDDQLQAYAELASTIDIRTITSVTNVETLQRLRDNDPKLTKLAVSNEMNRGHFSDDGYACYCPSDNEDLGWVGMFIGNNTHLQGLTVFGYSAAESRNFLPKLLAGISHNKSIRWIELDEIDLSNGEVARSLYPFFGKDDTLCEVSIVWCAFGGEGNRLLSTMLQSRNSLKTVHFDNNLSEDEQPTSMIAALRSHTRLERLTLDSMNVGSAECRLLATRLPCFSNLATLGLCGNNIDDSGVDALTGALANGNRLHGLDLSHNPSITTRGLQSIAGMLESPITNLGVLHLLWNGVNDEGANILAQALANNRKLRSLGLLATNEDRDMAARMEIAADDNLITARGWQAFANALCNTSSVEATYQSNHTLARFSRRKNNNLPRISDEGDGSGTFLLTLGFSLETNRHGPREEAARRKIVKHHLGSDTGMGHFAGMDRALLPCAMAWVPDDELSLLYRVVRNLHSDITGFVPSVEETPAGPDHKRQKTIGRLIP